MPVLSTSTVVVFTSGRPHYLVSGDPVRLVNVGEENPLNLKILYAKVIDSSTVQLYQNSSLTVSVYANDAGIRVSGNTETIWITSNASLVRLSTTSVSNLVYTDFPDNWVEQTWNINWINSSTTITWANSGPALKWINIL